jgi:hypothetical protein
MYFGNSISQSVERMDKITGKPVMPLTYRYKTVEMFLSRDEMLRRFRLAED